MVNRLPNGSIAIGAPGSDARKEAELADALSMRCDKCQIRNMLLYEVPNPEGPMTIKICGVCVTHRNKLLGKD